MRSAAAPQGGANIYVLFISSQDHDSTEQKSEDLQLTSWSIFSILNYSTHTQLMSCWSIDFESRKWLKMFRVFTNCRFSFELLEKYWFDWIIVFFPASDQSRFRNSQLLFLLTERLFTRELQIWSDHSSVTDGSELPSSPFISLFLLCNLILVFKENEQKLLVLVLYSTLLRKQTHSLSEMNL